MTDNYIERILGLRYYDGNPRMRFCSQRALSTYIFELVTWDINVQEKDAMTTIAPFV